MRTFLLSLLALFAFFLTTTTAQGKTLKVEDSSVGVWSIWTENTEELSSQYAGFVKYKDGDGFKLAKTRGYFANHIMMMNHDELQSQLNRGCQRGFFRCLLLGTELKLPTITRQDSRDTLSKEAKETEASAQLQMHNLANEDGQAISGEVVSRNESGLNFGRDAYHNLPKVRELMTRNASSEDGGKQGNTFDGTDTQSGLKQSVFSEDEIRLKPERGNSPLLRSRMEKERRDKPGPSRGQNDLHQTGSVDNISTENHSNSAKNRMIDALFGDSTLQLILGFALLFFLACLWDDYARHWYKRYILGKERVHKLKRYMYSQDET